MNIPFKTSRRQLLAAALTAACTHGVARSSASSSTRNCAVAPGGVHRRALFVLLDRTIEISRESQDRFVDLCFAGLEEGDRVLVGHFGGAGTHLIDLRLSLVVQHPYTKADIDRLRWDRSPAEIELETQCRLAQRQQLEQEIRRGFVSDARRGGVSPAIEASRLMLMSRRPGEHVRLFLLSDAIEHRPGFASFYGRKPESLEPPPAKAFAARLKAAGELPDARDVEVFHFFFGHSRHGLRPQAAVSSLASVWAEIWRQAGAKRWVFGGPFPLSDLG